MPELADLFAPVAWPHFVAHHLDRDWLHLPPGPGCDRAALFDFDRFDRLLSRPAIRAENLFAIDARRKLGPADYARADGTSDVLAVLDLFDSGATVVFRHADRHDSVLWRLTRRFEAALGAPAFANVYYAPAGGQSFPTHHDALDVYAVQCAGTKTWCFHRRIDPLPLAHEHSYGEADDYGPALAEAAPLVMAVDSGGKSVHAWFHVEGMGRQDQARFFAVACLFGADPTRWDICGWLRMPGGTREKADGSRVRQKILYCDAGALGHMGRVGQDGVATNEQ